jgi:hypothetical protein
MLSVASRKRTMCVRVRGIHCFTTVINSFGSSMLQCNEVQMLQTVDICAFQRKDKFTL